MAQASIGLIRRGFHEVPHLMIGGIIFAANIGFAAFSVRRHWKYERSRRQWKRRYTVVREEDFDPKKQVHKPDTYYPWW